MPQVQETVSRDNFSPLVPEPETVSRDNFSPISLQEQAPQEMLVDPSDFLVGVAMDVSEQTPSFLQNVTKETRLLRNREAFTKAQKEYEEIYGAGSFTKEREGDFHNLWHRATLARKFAETPPQGPGRKQILEEIRRLPPEAREDFTDMVAAMESDPSVVAPPESFAGTAERTAEGIVADPDRFVANIAPISKAITDRGATEEFIRDINKVRTEGVKIPGLEKTVGGEDLTIWQKAAEVGIPMAISVLMPLPIGKAKLGVKILKSAPNFIFWTGILQPEIKRDFLNRGMDEGTANVASLATAGGEAALELTLGRLTSILGGKVFGSSLKKGVLGKTKRAIARYFDTRPMRQVGARFVYGTQMESLEEVGQDAWRAGVLEGLQYAGEVAPDQAKFKEAMAQSIRSYPEMAKIMTILGGAPGIVSLGRGAHQTLGIRSSRKYFLTPEGAAQFYESNTKLAEKMIAGKQLRHGVLGAVFNTDENKEQFRNLLKEYKNAKPGEPVQAAAKPGEAAATTTEAKPAETAPPEKGTSTGKKETVVPKPIPKEPKKRWKRDNLASAKGVDEFVESVGPRAYDLLETLSPTRKSFNEHNLNKYITGANWDAESRQKFLEELKVKRERSVLTPEEIESARRSGISQEKLLAKRLKREAQGRAKAQEAFDLERQKPTGTTEEFDKPLVDLENRETIPEARVGDHINIMTRNGALEGTVREPGPYDQKQGTLNVRVGETSLHVDPRHVIGVVKKAQSLPEQAKDLGVKIGGLKPAAAQELIVTAEQAQEPVDKTLKKVLPTVMGARNVDAEALREDVGLGGLPGTERLAQAVSLEEAHRTGLDKQVDRISKEIIEDETRTRSLSLLEQAAFKLRLPELKHEARVLKDEINRTKDQAKKAALEHEKVDLQMKIDDATLANKLGITEPARTMQMRQGMMEFMDYGEASLRAEGKITKGSELSEAEGKNLENYSERIEGKEADLGAEIKKHKKRVAQDVISRRPSKKRSPQELQAERAELTQNVAELMRLNCANT